MKGSILPNVLVLAPPRYVGPLGAMRSLAAMGVSVYALTHRGPSAANASRHCSGTFDVGVNGRVTDDPGRDLEQLMKAGRSLGDLPVLIAGSDEWALFVATHADVLRTVFRFPRMPFQLVHDLASKRGLHRLAVRHGLPTPGLAFPARSADVPKFAATLQYPVILKPILSRPGIELKIIVESAAHLVAEYPRLEERPEAPNVMFQEYVPGGDEDVWIFNGYFDAASRCLAAFTGQKLRQLPAHMGVASLGVCRQNEQVIAQTTAFLAALGYRGVVDIGYRFDRRDGKYKVLDINPRLGGAFRLFVDRNGLDVVRALYLDLTGQRVPPVEPKDGRRWWKEDSDLIALKRYREIDGLRLIDWLRSLRGVEEAASFSFSDPVPFLVAMKVLVTDTMAPRWRRLIGQRTG